MLILIYLSYVVFLVYVSYIQIKHIKKSDVYILSQDTFINEGKKIIAIEKFRIKLLLIKSCFMLLYAVSIFEIFEEHLGLIPTVIIGASVLYLMQLITSSFILIIKKQKKMIRKRVAKYISFVVAIDMIRVIYITLFPFMQIVFKYHKPSHKSIRYKSPMLDFSFEKDIKIYKVSTRKTPAYVLKMNNIIEVFIENKLIQKLSKKELLAVIYHEIGHYKQCRVILPIVILSYVGLVTYLFCLLLENNIDKGMLFILFDIALFVLFQIRNFLKRREENQADLYSISMIKDGVQFKNALIKSCKIYDKYPSNHSLFNIIYSKYPLISSRINRTCCIFMTNNQKYMKDLKC